MELTLIPLRKKYSDVISSLFLTTPFGITSETEKFLHMSVSTSSGILYHYRSFRESLSWIEHSYLIPKKLQHSWLLLMFQIVKKTIVSGQAVIPSSHGQELPSKVRHRFRRISNGFSDKFRCYDDFILLTKSFPA